MPKAIGLPTTIASREETVAYSDIHCHVLPGIDDGPKDMDGAVSLVRHAHKSGAARIVATPHFLPGLYEPKVSDIRETLEALRERLRSEGIPVEILEGAEAYISERLSRDFREGKILPLGGGSHVLVELPSMSIPLGFTEELQALREAGAGVVLAHPERNMELRRNLALARRLVESGVLLQVNAGSFVGAFGREAASFASSLLAEGHVRFIASDAHKGHSPDLRECGPDIRPALWRAFRSHAAIARFLGEAEETFNRIASRRVTFGP